MSDSDLINDELEGIIDNLDNLRTVANYNQDKQLSNYISMILERIYKIQRMREIKNDR